MIISEVIAALKAALEAHGDVEVILPAWDTYFPAKSVALVDENPHEAGLILIDGDFNNEVDPEVLRKAHSTSVDSDGERYSNWDQEPI